MQTTDTPRHATMRDIVDHIAGRKGEWVAIHAVSPDAAQLNITDAIAESIAHGLVEYSDPNLRGRGMVRLTAYGKRVASLRAEVDCA